MPTDIELGENAVWIIAHPVDPEIVGRVTCWAGDFELDGGEKRRAPSANAGMRRAMVHGLGDVLVLNFTGDYTGGLRVDGKTNINGSLAVAQKAVLNGGLIVTGGTKVQYPLFVHAPPGGGFTLPELAGPPGNNTTEQKIELVHQIQEMRAAIADLATRLKKLGG